MDMVVLLQKAECMFSDPRAESYNFHLLVVKAAMREWMGTAPEMGVGGVTPSLPEIMLWRMQIWWFIHSVLLVFFFFLNIYLFVCAGVLLQHAGSLVEVCGI